MFRSNGLMPRGRHGALSTTAVPEGGRTPDRFSNSTAGERVGRLLAIQRQVQEALGASLSYLVNCRSGKQVASDGINARVGG
jgi:hypothetical protein